MDRQQFGSEESSVRSGKKEMKTRQEDCLATSKTSPVDIDKIASLLQFASTGNVDEVRRILDDGLDVDSPDYDGRTALHLAASEGNLGVVQLLLERNATVNPVDRWQDTPWLNAERYIKGDTNKRNEYKAVSDLLAAKAREKGKEGTNQVENQRAEEREELEQMELLMEQLKEDYEIAIEELNLQEATVIGVGSYGQVKLANWRGTKVAAKTILEKLAKREEIQKEFRMELLLLQSLRHPNIVEFLGAVTKNDELVIVTEYLAKGDLHEIIERKGRIPARDAVSYALDIARGMNYLHQHKPTAIVHRDLKPRNLLQDEAGHLKVADFGLSKLMEPQLRKGNEAAYEMTGGTGTYRYMAPEVFLHKSYDKSVDVFSFAIIVTEMFEGPVLLSSTGHDVAQKRAQADRRPEFRMKTYPPGLKDLLRECWARNPRERPTFEKIIGKLETMLDDLQKSRWKPRPMITGAVNTISNKWKDFQHRVQQSRSELFSIDEDGKPIKTGGRSIRGGSTMSRRTGGESHRGGASRSPELYLWASPPDEGSVSTFGPSDDSNP
ncbi:unnamed protein product [Calypogeia fissa]